ncbi:hypothetical protein [Mesorhizobium sp.]|uniref:hypothetical protein n=1 Tax=Mesorhizobium sp. TaxID=1871066 RepID=UPI001202FB91|nr:hypothetical protein [Mesorhizobium sp.]TIN83070.1 MAG: hypothetical protein E5X97_27440 [Mesorhizobium sp.]
MRQRKDDYMRGYSDGIQDGRAGVNAADEMPLATFRISIFPDRTTMRTNAIYGARPDELLARARLALDGEVDELAKCPFHLSSEIDTTAFEVARNSFVMPEHKRGHITRAVLTAYIAALPKTVECEHGVYGEGKCPRCPSPTASPIPR